MRAQDDELIERPFRPATPTLYHGSPRPIERDRLTPRFNQSVGGHEGQFVFATDHLPMARCYALKDDHMLGVGMFQDERTPYCVIFNRESFLAARVTGTVYQFPGDGFKQVIVGSYATHEYISSQTVRLHRADRIPVNGIDDLMADGVQVLFTRPGLSENEFFLKLRQAHYNPETLLQQENLISENVVRGLKPALI